MPSTSGLLWIALLFAHLPCYTGHMLNEDFRFPYTLPFRKFVMNIAGTALILLFHGQFRAPFFRGSDWKMRQNAVSLRICYRSRFGVRASVGPASPAVLLLEFAVNFIRPIVCVCARSIS